MSGEKYDISDYGIFDTAIGTTSKYSEAIKFVQDAMSNANTQLSNESVFMGPICESCVTGFDTVNVKLDSVVTNFGTWGPVSAAFLFPVWLLIKVESLTVFGGVAAVGGLVIYKHKENFRNAKEGKEILVNEFAEEMHKFSL